MNKIREEEIKASDFVKLVSLEIITLSVRAWMNKEEREEKRDNGVVKLVRNL